MLRSSTIALPSTAYVFHHTEVTRSNLKNLYQEIIRRVAVSSHIAIDFEFSGLARRSTLNNMHHHYLAVKKAVEQYTIVSLGLSIAKAKEPSTSDRNSQPYYEFDNFDFLMLNEGPILFDKGTAHWLVMNGFDFNKLFLQGISFQPAFNLKKEEKEKQRRQSGNSSSKCDDRRRTMFESLMKKIIELMKYKKIPLILHNGLHDIMYLYHSFIGQLPDTFSSFLEKISVAFPSGIYDTKFMTAADSTFTATFLSYLFVKCDRLRVEAFKNLEGKASIDGCQKNKSKGVYFDVLVNVTIKAADGNETLTTGVKRKLDDVETDTANMIRERSSPAVIHAYSSTIATAVSSNKDSTSKTIKVCRDFSMKGYCCNPDHTDFCEEHNIQLVIHREMGPPVYSDYYTCNFNDGKGAHSAYFDAYMTAFVFCHCKHTLSVTALHEAKNKIRIDFEPNFIRFPSPSTGESVDDSQQRLISSQLSTLSSELSAYSSQTSIASLQE